MISNDYTFMSRLVSNSSVVRDELAKTQEQVASGRVSDTYSGLGGQARTSLSLNPALAHQAAWSANIDVAQSRLEVTQSALSSIADIAAKFNAQLNSYNANDPNSVTTLAQQAKTALSQVGDLLNSRSGDIYVFAGQDTDHPPVPSTDADVMSAGLLATSAGTAPFSSTIGTTAPTAEVGQGQTVSIGVLANANTLTTSAAPTSGSYMRDTLTALAKLAGLTGSSSPAADVSTARGLLGSSISAMASETGSLGNIQSNLTSRQTTLASFSAALTKQLSSAQEVDAAAAITKASMLQTQLQASYQIIASARSLSLANYL